jgi:flagellar hook assembly protein FlgD
MDDIQNPGLHNIIWNGKNSNDEYVSSGIYIYQIKANDFTDSKMMVMLK